MKKELRLVLMVLLITVGMIAFLFYKIWVDNFDVDPLGWVGYTIANLGIIGGLFVLLYGKFWSAYVFMDYHAFDVESFLGNVQGQLDEDGYFTGKYAVHYGLLLFGGGLIVLLLVVMFEYPDKPFNFFLMVCLEPIILIISYKIIKKYVNSLKEEERHENKIPEIRFGVGKPVKLKITKESEFREGVKFCPQCDNPYADDPDITICIKCGTGLI